MTVAQTSAGLPKGEKTTAATRKPAATSAKAKVGFTLFGLFDEDNTGEATVLDPAGLMERHKKILRLVSIQSVVLTVLLVLLLLLVPVFRPVYKFVAIRPDKKTMDMASMTAPNLTDRAVLSWSATAITEILTFGFGDLDRRVLGQRKRFTDEGWNNFLEGFIRRSIHEIFKSQQIVLTTVPTDTPVVVWKGREKGRPDGDYVWIVEMPIVMTFATSDNVSQRRRSIVRLTLTRVPTDQNINGIGIKMWQMV